MVAVMWGLEIIDVAAGHRLDRLGIEPREADGLVGVATAPFLHAGFGHLASNTVPFAALGLAIAFSGLVRLAAVTLIVMLVGGLGTWLVAPQNTVHIGASGVVFGYAAYLIVRGIFNRSAGELALAAVVVLFMGGALLGGLVPRSGVSWQGHLFGALGGVVAARLLARPRRRPPELAGSRGLPASQRKGRVARNSRWTRP
ncbi:MAG: rhomboid family intramembrane serine protease [Actinomycetota bacterium]|nr:rhomboid family intramembrane serine protease [Actinomycetota bacterium]MDQ3720285.1 rhomboid family intramembrane serine protease [Actinomycetota bacterium]